jgi:hypothetical protein
MHALERLGASGVLHGSSSSSKRHTVSGTAARPLNLQHAL